MRHYPRYKSSGVEWLGEIPFNWSTIRIKFMDILIMGQSPESKDVTDYEKGLPFLQGNAEFTDTHPIPRHWCEKANKIAVVNDLLLSVRAPVGALNLSDQIYGIGRGICAIRAHKNNVRFLYYLLSISKEELNKVSTGTTFVAITIPNLSNIKIPKVSLPEQQSIVRFLDYKTGQIDKFVANRQKQIELLKEQKAAIINKAVTKGINPNVKMKDSGIEWLPEVPTTWNVWKMKFLTRIETGNKNTDDAEENGLYPFFVRSDKVERLSAYSFDGEAILTAGDGVGVAKVFHYANCKMAIHQRVYKIFGFKRILGEFLYYYIKDNFYKEVIKLSAKTTVDSLRMPMLSNFPVAYPSKEEQLKILSYIKVEIDRMDNLIKKYQKQIDLMKEYRTSLISQAVTGKIDVRDWQPNTKNYSTESFPISIAAEN